MTPFKGKLRTRHLEIVLTVAELGNLSKAAAQLHSTQSGLSRAIAEIEELVGARLFERTARGTSCTPLGEAMCRHARQLLTGFRKAEIDLAALSRGDEGSLTVGCFSMFAGWPVAQAATRFRQAYPRITLTLEIGTHERLIDDLDAGALDVLISRFSSTVDPRIYRSANLLDDPVVLVCAPMIRWRTAPTPRWPTAWPIRGSPPCPAAASAANWKWCCTAKACRFRI
ncbi:LysR family transcriptional regulator [Achromobacter xylosoxidans]